MQDKGRENVKRFSGKAGPPWTTLDFREVLIPGTKRRRYLEQNARAADLTLEEGDLQRLDSAFPPGAAAGPRYPEAQLKGLGI